MQLFFVIVAKTHQQRTNIAKGKLKTETVLTIKETKTGTKGDQLSYGLRKRCNLKVNNEARLTKINITTRKKRKSIKKTAIKTK